MRTVSGNNITLNVAASDTIADVKAKIAEKEGEDVERLIYGTQLEAQRTLATMASHIILQSLNFLDVLAEHAILRSLRTTSNRSKLNRID